MADDDRWIIAGLGNPGPEYAGNPDRDLDADLLAPADQDQVGVLDVAPDRVPIHRLGQGQAGHAGHAVQPDQHVRRLQREHQLVAGQHDVARLLAVAVEHGRHQARTARTAGGALAKLGARLGGDADLRHGGHSSCGG